MSTRSNPPTRRLPDDPSLEHLKNEARSLQRSLRSGDEQLIKEVSEQLADQQIDFSQISLSSTQWLLARCYGFASWPRLRRQLDVIATYTRRPEPAAETEPESSDHRAVVDHLLALSVLNYTRDRGNTFDRPRRLLQRRPELATADAFTMAATGRSDELDRLLADDPAAASRSGGPYDWPPLLYCCSSRVSEPEPAVAVVRSLLAAGADPNTGYLWFGLTSAFTALTCAIGGGEQGQPPHPAAIPIARLLLDAGADPNDNQALYNRMFTPADDHLELLFDYGLGTDLPSPWRDRLGDSYPTPVQMLGEQLRWAAGHGFIHRVRLLLAHGVSSDNRGYHPNFGNRTAADLAAEAGHHEIVELLTG
ncbi:ankyrin repeat domain-containing protein [Microlunatus soli]|uniref:Ankyrin repeat n=1 Tax=Microlunatus soli TaxID=630515 RepID=A0A1H1PIQ0_9ACTN|nr:ankyrin repeat domain-containing protein [Microlunatus soli]SDS10983.1 Ankyrin repeat [Microlunatus soli]